MSGQPQFRIYDASAGSGKTYTLVKEYLCTALRNSSADGYQSALAITFTNKAVQELKSRLLEVLADFSNKKIIDEPTQLFKDVAQNIGIDHSQLCYRSEKMLGHLLQHYSHFSISTIDKLTHQIVRTFSRDFGLSSSFELVLDSKSFLRQTVDLLIEKAGSDAKLTEVLLRFVTFKADQDKSWDVAIDLNKIAELIYNENHYEPLLDIGNKSWADFQDLEKSLQQKKQLVFQELILQTKELQQQLRAAQIEPSSFSYGELPKHIEKVLEGKWEGLPGTRLCGQIEKRALLKKTARSQDHTSIEKLYPVIEVWLSALNQHVPTLNQTDAFLAQLVPLSVLNAIQQSLQELQEEQNSMLLSSFNALIAKSIQDTPTPFIYERLGVRYQHYYIDEFQDTSALQWNNTACLAAHALSTEYGQLTLVGDAKQAIYRWRGGYPEQFLALSGGASPFEGLPPETIRLPKNYRSLDNIVQTNNTFFRSIADHIEVPTYKELYIEGSQQEKNNRPGGWTTISFVEGDRVEDREPLYLEATYSRIQEVLARGYSLSDICVLVRKRKHGVAVTAFLNQHQVPVVSAETLLIDQSPEVRVLLALLKLRVDNEDQAARKQVLSYFVPDNQDVFVWFSSHLKGDIESMFEAICERQKRFSFKVFSERDTYSALEYAIDCFGLSQDVSAFLSGLLEELLQRNAQQPLSDAAFLAYWQEVREKKSVTVPENLDAVRVMTIHKSKGLAFPIVILPYAETPIYESRSAECWHPVEPDQYAGFSNMFVRANPQLKASGPVGKALVDKQRAAQMLDAFNVLYVGMTRSERELHLIGHRTEKTTSTYGGLLSAFVDKEHPKQIGTASYGFGNPTEKEAQNPKPMTQTKSSRWISNITPAVLYKHRKPVWNQSQQKALSYGNLFHDLMAEIYVPADVDAVVQRAVEQGKIGGEEAASLLDKMKAIVQMPELGEFFDSKHHRFRERTLFEADGTQLRPDSFVILPDRKVSILDYKTGSEKAEHEQQILSYASFFKKMGYKITGLYILYVSEMLKLKPIS